MAPDPNNADTLRRGARLLWVTAFMRATRRCISGESDTQLSFSKAPEISSTSGGREKTCSYLMSLSLLHWCQECAYIRSLKTLLRRLTHWWLFSLLRWLTHGWGFSWEGWLMDGVFLTGSALLISLEPASSLPVCLWRWWGWTMTCWAVEWEEEWTYSKAEKVDSPMGFFTGSHLLINLQPTSSMPFKGLKPYSWPPWEDFLTGMALNLSASLQGEFNLWMESRIDGWTTPWEEEDFILESESSRHWQWTGNGPKIDRGAAKGREGGSPIYQPSATIQISALHDIKRDWQTRRGPSECEHCEIWTSI